MHNIRFKALQCVSLPTRAGGWLAVAVLFGFALRLPLNDVIPPRWDEGWSVAHALLPLDELLRITAADVHPPLFYLLLGAWLRGLGQADLFAARYLSVCLSVLAIPLAHHVAQRWGGDRALALMAAFCMAWLPLAVYYGAVVRMYAAVPAWVLLTLYGALGLRRDRATRGDWLALVLGATGAMYTLYHAAWALAALGAWSLAWLVRRRDRRAWARWLSAIAAALLLWSPWAAFALPQLAARAAAESQTNIAQHIPIAYFLRLGAYELTMSQQLSDVGLVATGGFLALGAISAALRRRFDQLARLGLPLLMIALTLIGVSAAARQWAFNARMLIAATPALALALAWSFAQMRPAPVRALATAAMLIVYAPTSADFVYRKTLEVFDPYNPAQYCARIAPRAQDGDVVIFNVLSPAGFYALQCGDDAPPFSYALTWDPVIEPRERWQARLRALAQHHARLWLVLYRGLAGENGHLRGWMDTHLFPAYAEWGEEEVFFGLYVAARETLEPAPVADARWGAIQLVEARLPRVVTAGAAIPVQLVWRADEKPSRDYKIYVHALAPDGFLIAQHDAQPLHDLRPMTTWTPGEVVTDHHGLLVPEGYRGVLRVVAGLYDPESGERLRSATGADAIVLGDVHVR